MAKRVEWKAPLKKDGSLMVYPDIYYRDADGNSKKVESETVPRDTTWDLSLVFDGFDKGYRSAYRFIATDEEGRKWPMSVKQFRNMMEQIVIDHAKVTGRFGVVKQGQNFSLTYVGPQDVES